MNIWLDKRDYIGYIIADYEKKEEGNLVVLRNLKDTKRKTIEQHEFFEYFELQNN